MKNNRWMKLVITMLCIMTMLFTFVACGNNSGTNDTSAQGGETESQKETGSQIDSEEGNQTESEVEGETETQTDDGSGTYTDTEGTTEVEGDEQESEEPESSVDSGDDSNDNADISGTDEILGEGSASSPYLETPVVDGDVMTVTTVAIGSGKSVYYDIYRASGMIFEIRNTNAYVEYNGKTYEAKNGVVSFEVENSVSNAPVSFKIGNKGSTSTAFVIQFSNPTGSFMNPTIISSFANSYSLHVDAGNEVGHYYKYTAEKAGTITFYISQITSSTKNAKAFISVTNNNTYANRTTDADGVKDGNYVKVSLDVSAGDEIMIQVGASPTATWKYPAEDIVWVAQYQ